MSFIAFKQNGKDVIINTDMIISVDLNFGFNKIMITCTDHITVQVDDPEDYIRRSLGVKKEGERKIGF